MKISARWTRLGTGFGLLLLVLVLGFGLANALIPHWGSTPAEQLQTLPGDEIFPHPVLKWEHGITINARPEDVWPWLAQMGDTHAGYYSFRYIEKAITAMAGEDASSYYNNTNQIHPDWQSPSLGQGMIMRDFVLRDYKAGQYLVAAPKPGQDAGGLLWTWYILPAGSDQTRLIVHMAIQIPGAEGNKAIEAGFNLATFMMERKMMEGIKLRAEGGAEADWVQPVEALLWLATLVMGLIAARRFFKQANWLRPLSIGLAAVALLFVLTYLQPALWLRVLADLALLSPLVWDTRLETATALRPALATR